MVLTTPGAAEAWRPDQHVFAASDVIPDAAILQHSTVRGEVQGDAPAMRVAYISDADAEFVDEGDDFTAVDPTLNEALIYTAKIGQLVKLSHEQYRQNGTADELARSVGRAIIKKSDAAFLAQAAPTSPDVAPAPGLANVTGIESETGVSGDLDALIDLEAAVRANGASPTSWVLSPRCWASLRQLKQATSSNLGILGAGTDNAEPRLLSIPVQVNAALAGDTGLLVDANSIISAVSQLTVSVSDQRYFESDSIAVRATLRQGHTVPRPNHIGLFTLA